MSEYDEASKVITSARKSSSRNWHQMFRRPSSAQDFQLSNPGRYFAAKKWHRIKSSVLSQSIIIRCRTFGYCKPCYFWRRCDLSLEKRCRCKAVRAITTKSSHVKIEQLSDDHRQNDSNTSRL